MMFRPRSSGKQKVYSTTSGIVLTLFSKATKKVVSAATTATTRSTGASSSSGYKRQWLKKNIRRWINTVRRTSNGVVSSSSSQSTTIQSLNVTHQWLGPANAIVRIPSLFPLLFPLQLPTNNAVAARIAQQMFSSQSNSIGTSNSAVTKNTLRQWKRVAWKVGIGSIVGGITVLSLATRKWRKQHIHDLPLAYDSNAFYLSSSGGTRHSDNTDEESSSNDNAKTTRMPVPSPVSASQPPLAPRRDLREVFDTVTRAGLMGNEKSVKHELETIRQWHRDHGYHGGLVLRELTQPLFSPMAETMLTTGGDVMEQVEELQEEALNQRECYYLYYQVHPNGHIDQQIFCRGTTLKADVWTGLTSFLYRTVYDEELQCHVYYGFQQHAHRLLEDVLPLLVPPPPAPTQASSSSSNPTTTMSSMNRATVELCGHSLGGATALLVAAKLRQRGYNVTRVTTVGAPRVCPLVQSNDEDEDSSSSSPPSPTTRSGFTSDCVQRLVDLLPRDTLRIETDTDLVCKLPPTKPHWFQSWRKAERRRQQHSHEDAASSSLETPTTTNNNISSTFVDTLVEHVLKPFQYPSYIGNLLLFETSSSEPTTSTTTTQQHDDYSNKKLRAKYIPFQTFQRHKEELVVPETSHEDENEQALSSSTSWVNSFWLHTRVWESLREMPTCHKIVSYQGHLRDLMETFQQQQQERDRPRPSSEGISSNSDGKTTS